jgi:amino acid adenylation domain-containing protein
MFALRSAPPAGLTMAGLTLDTFEADMNAAGFPLTLQLEERDGRLDVRWEYRTDLFEDVTIRRMADNFVTLLMSIPTDPRRRISELYLLSPDERRLVLQSFNDTRRDYGPARCLHEMFEEQSARTPEATAVVHENVRLTYGELNERANRLARRLLSLGVGPERLVGVCMRRTPELIVALLGVLKAGGAYVPLDPEWPRRRAEFVLEDAGVVVVLTQESLLGALPDGRHAILCVDAEAEAVARQDGANPAGGAAPDNLAYVIYTSGSTGRPKGVAVPHRAVFNLLRWAGETFTGGELAGVLASSPVSLDLAVFELFAPLACGGAVVLAEDLTALPELAAAGEVTLVNAVPSAVGEMLRRGGMPASVRAVNLAGEQPGRELVEIIFARTNAEQVRILYGPTEGTAYSTCDTITRGAEGDPAVGRPVANTEAYILDRSVRPAPLGAAGELYLGGSGLARGYVRRPSLTAARFVPDPYSGEPGARLYRTGDVARYLPDGRIEFLGRPEGQVKLRGFRVETGEIESALVAHPGVRDAVVVARDGAGGEKSLVAYVVFEADAGGDIARLRETLGESLPDFMIPSQFVALDELPLDVNGKVDRAVLPEPTAAAPERPYVPPADDLERGLASISSEVLGAERVGRYDNFFDLGGHSLLATRLVSRVREAFGVDVRLREVFDRPTLAEMASTVRSLLHAAESPDATPPPTDEEA